MSDAVLSVTFLSMDSGVSADQVCFETDILIPLSPSLPLFAPIFTSVLRSLTTAEYLHQPYFEIKGMQSDEVWTWVEERAWAYRCEFGRRFSIYPLPSLV